MVNLEMMKQLLDRGIEPTLLNEVLRRELAEAALGGTSGESARATTGVPWFRLHFLRP